MIIPLNDFINFLLNIDVAFNTIRSGLTFFNFVQKIITIYFPFFNLKMVFLFKYFLFL